MTSRGLILTHDRADLDALASLVAAARLYPDADAVLPTRLSGPVKQFWALYQDVLPVKADIHLSESPAFIVLVDTHDPHSLGKYAETVKQYSGAPLVAYDHHPGEGRESPAESHIEPRGAAIGLLVDRLIERQIPIPPLEATLYLLGLYADTGSLSFSSTTPADCRTASALLERGADLSFVRSFLHGTLSDDQRRLFDALTSSAADFIVQGHPVTFVTATWEGSPPDLSTIVGRVEDSLGVDSLFALVESGADVFVVARTRDPAVRLDLLLSSINGGGHAGAASAHVKSATASRLLRRILKLLSESLSPPPTAWDVMSRPVHGIFPETTLREAFALMGLFGHSGLIIWDPGRPGHAAGIITRKDIDKALRLNLGRVPVKGFMSAALVTAEPGHTLDEVHRLFVERGIGRVPVIAENGEIIGIVTRKDIIRSMGLMKKDASSAAPPASSVLASVDSASLELFRRLGECAERLRVRVYLVGGPVRDILLGRPTFDWDILAEGPGLEFAQAAAHDLKARLLKYPQFQTAKLIFKDGSHLDVATAREEFYERPAALPRVERASIRADLLRRDFTMNTLAVALNPGIFGQLVDFFNGYRDLGEKRIRVLHNLSFVEDPTRIFRAVRYEQRLGFQLEEKTAGLLKTALKIGVLKKLTGDRLRNEIVKVLAEPDPARCLARLQDLGVFRGYDPRFRLDEKWFAPEIGVPAALHALHGAREFDIRAVYLLLWLAGFSPSRQAKMVALLRLDRTRLKNAHELARLPDTVKKTLKCRKPSEYCQTLSRFTAEFLAAFWVLVPEVRPALEEYWNRWRHVRLKISGADLKKAGLREGPEMGKIMRKLLKMKLDGLLPEKDELKAAFQLHED